jgi:nitroimidazol reductase NimA-like FMN-containing flavoprotein (pyridoxamine 5'-phosphate oxidase superfamily)
MARENNSMSQAEIEAFVSSVEWMVLGVLDEAGAPQGSPVATMASGGLLYFTVPAASAVEACLIRDPRCCCTVDVFPSYYEIRGATVHGSASKVAADAAITAELAARAARHGLSNGPVFAIPLLDDAFGFDFAKLQRR